MRHDRSLQYRDQIGCGTPRFVHTGATNEHSAKRTVLGETRRVVESECGWEWWLLPGLFAPRQQHGDRWDYHVTTVRQDAAAAKHAFPARIALVGRDPR